MIYEFEGRTEKEAIDKAAQDLGIERDEFDVEILETQRSGLFKKGYVKIQVHADARNVPGEGRPIKAKTSSFENPPPNVSMQSRLASPNVSMQSLEKNLVSFVEGLIERMGYRGKVSVLYQEENKLGLKIDSEHSSILIGKKGKNLDALQLLANIYAGRQGREDVRIILDSENYRIRREESLVRLAYTVADKVRENRNSILLEPMNPFDRRLIHTTLNDISDVETKSEGEGLYKQVRVYYKGLRAN
jgi:spoIIIJ-associated protein